MRVLGDEVTAEWIAEMTEKGFDGAQLVADAKAIVAEVAAETK